MLIDVAWSTDPHFDIRDDGFGHPQDNHTGKPTDSRAGYRANVRDEEPLFVLLFGTELLKY